MFTRWVLTCVVVIGMLTWWWPGYRTWGGAAIGLLTVWTLWLIWRTVCGDGTVPGNPVYLALLGPAALLTYHLARSGLGTAAVPEGPLAGEINISMIFQMALLALSVMLCQSLLSHVAGGSVHVSLAGAAMMLGAGAAMAWGRAAPVPNSLAPLGLAGLAVWLVPLWGPGPRVKMTVTEVLNSPGRLGRVGVAFVAACLLIQASPPRGLFLTAGVAGGVLLLAGAAFRRYRAVNLTAGALASASCLVPLAVRLLSLPKLSLLRLAWIGEGEGAIRQVSPAGGGVMILLGTVGPVGLLWAVVFFAASLCWLLIRSRKMEAERQWRAVVWTIASALAGCALLTGGGLVIPAATLAAGFTWGLLPAMLGRPIRSRPGVILVACLVVMLTLLGLARKDGLVAWSAWTFKVGEVFLHVTTGFLLAMVMAWFMGRRSVWWGLVGVILALLAGGAGELLQAVASLRMAELKDWINHSIGCAAATVPYLLAKGSRLCESPEVVLPQGPSSFEQAYRSP